MNEGRIKLGKKDKFLEGSIEEQIDLFRKTLPPPKYFYPFWDQSLDEVLKLLPNILPEESNEIPCWFESEECPAAIIIWTYSTGYSEWISSYQSNYEDDFADYKEKAERLYVENAKKIKIDYKNINLLWMYHDEDSDVLTYCFDVDKTIKYFQAKLNIISISDINIESLKHIGNFDNWLTYAIAPIQPKINGILVRLSWSFVKGKNIVFPIRIDSDTTMFDEN
jgi:hypothetical protein